MSAPGAVSVHGSDSAVTDWVDAWRTDGYVIIEDFLDPQQVEEGRDALLRLVPTWEQYRDDRASWPQAKPLTWLQFPYASDELNRLTLHPRLLEFTREALRSDEILLSHSEILSKYADGVDFDQPMHVDFGNNTLVVPSADDIDQVASITYYSDVTIDLGPTRVVSFEDSAPWRSRASWKPEDAPELFGRERAVTVPAGGAVLYTMKTYHRGSRFAAEEGSRYSHHIAFQQAANTWAGWRAFAAEPGGNIGRALTALDADQRSVVGFPAPGNPYWTPATIEAVQARYPDMDMSAYC